MHITFNGGHHMQGINVESVARVCKPLAGVLTRASSRHAPLAALAPRAADALAVGRKEHISRHAALN